MITYMSLPNEPGHSHSVYLAIAKIGWSVVITGVRIQDMVE